MAELWQKWTKSISQSDTLRRCRKNLNYYELHKLGRHATRVPNDNKRYSMRGVRIRVHSMRGIRKPRSLSWSVKRPSAERALESVKYQIKFRRLEDLNPCNPYNLWLKKECGGLLLNPESWILNPESWIPKLFILWRKVLRRHWRGWRRSWSRSSQLCSPHWAHMPQA